MGWKTTIFAAFLAFAAFVSVSAQPAHATSITWLMCWVPSNDSGAHDCVKLPSNWRISGVSKNYCSSAASFCSDKEEVFRINRRNLRSVARYAPVSPRDYGVTVTIYTGVYR